MNLDHYFQYGLILVGVVLALADALLVVFIVQSQRDKKGEPE